MIKKLLNTAAGIAFTLGLATATPTYAQDENQGPQTPLKDPITAFANDNGLRTPLKTCVADAFNRIIIPNKMLSFDPERKRLSLTTQNDSRFTQAGVNTSLTGYVNENTNTVHIVSTAEMPNGKKPEVFLLINFSNATAQIGANKEIDKRNLGRDEKEVIARGLFIKKATQSCMATSEIKFSPF